LLFEQVVDYTLCKPNHVTLNKFYENRVFYLFIGIKLLS